MYQVGLFATGRGQGSRQLLQAVHDGIESGRLPVEISFVFSNRAPGEFEATDGFFQMVRDYGYPLVTYSFRQYRERVGDDPDWREGYDREVIRLLEPYAPDLCVLAGYLLIFSHELCRRYTSINLHPAAPGGPIGMWEKVIWQLIETEARTSGNTIFHVTEHLDLGPTVTYSTFPITGPDFDENWQAVRGKDIARLKDDLGEDLKLFQQIRRHASARERPLVVETLRAFAEGRVRIEGGAVVDGDGKAMAGIDLTAEIEAALTGGG